MKKTALITGITGQDGSYLAEFLLKKDYEVHGIIRRSSSFNTQRIENIFQDPHEKNARLKLYYGDLSDGNSIGKIIQRVKPSELYNLASQTHVKTSFEIPEYTSDINALGTLRILESIKDYSASTKFYQASTSELFGKVVESPQSEKTPFYPRSPYAFAKLFSFWATKNYREAYKIFACNGILFNHESERRGETFVTRKITRGLARIKIGLQEKIYLGNLDSKRDWGYAPEFVEAMWLMLQQDEPEDYIIGTGETHSIREFLEEAAKSIGLEMKSNGEKGILEKYLDYQGRTILEIDSNYFRPSEVEFLLADPSKAKEKLNWISKTKFKDLVRKMAEYDLELAKKEKHTTLWKKEQ